MGTFRVVKVINVRFSWCIILLGTYAVMISEDRSPATSPDCTLAPVPYHWGLFISPRRPIKLNFSSSDLKGERSGIWVLVYIRFAQNFFPIWIVPTTSKVTTLKCECFILLLKYYLHARFCTTWRYYYLYLLSVSVACPTKRNLVLQIRPSCRIDGLRAKAKYTQGESNWIDALIIGQRHDQCQVQITTIQIRVPRSLQRTLEACTCSEHV